jgi:hypothetical protein
MVVRNSWVIQGQQAAAFIDAAEFEKLKKRGDEAVKQWINGELVGTTVTVVLVGSRTCVSRWVSYEISESKRLGHGLFGIDISKIKDLSGAISDCCAELPHGYPFYRWNRDEGYKNLGAWVEKAARTAGK